jgi:hypothetical protein
MVAPSSACGAVVFGVPRIPAWDPRLLWACLALVGAVLVGALAISIVDRWRKRSDHQSHRVGDQLEHFRTLYERGELSSEEFERIRGLLQQRLVRELEARGREESATPAQESLPKPPPPQAEQR